MNELKRLRHELHQNPELSNRESGTALRLNTFLTNHKPDDLLTNIGGEGLLAVYCGTEPGPDILFRADMDALPIMETNSISYKSSTDGVAHLCGHDGHMAILSGLAVHLSKHRPKRGRALLLYQPAEETGEGAFRALQDIRKQDFNPEYAFALHNLPRYPKGSMLYIQETFAAASKGLLVKMHGKSSHAAEPEKGLSPALTVARTIEGLVHLSKSVGLFKGFVLLTVVYAKLGDVAFGTTPGYAEVGATLRSFSNEDMQLLTALSEELIRKVASEQNITVEISYTDDFPATVNDADAVACLTRSANKYEIPVVMLEHPNRWSEDFAHFTLACKGAIVGLGAGVNHPDLHRTDYDFPDDIIEPGVNLFVGVVEELLGS